MNKQLFSLTPYAKIHSMSVESFSYLWQIPSKLPSKDSLLIAGYLRQINGVIDHEILSLCETFFMYNTGVAMSDICNMQCGEIFSNKILNICGLKWCVEIYTNGDKKSSEGFVQFYIELISLSPKITKVSFNYNIELLETNTTFKKTTIFNFDGDRSEGWPQKYLNLAKIKHLKQLTFAINLKMFDIYKSDGTMVTQEELKAKYFDPENYMHYRDSFEWIINDP
eukprot:464161_1